MISTVLCYSATSGSFVAEYGTSCRVDMGWSLSPSVPPFAWRPTKYLSLGALRRAGCHSEPRPGAKNLARYLQIALPCERRARPFARRGLRVTHIMLIAIKRGVRRDFDPQFARTTSCKAGATARRARRRTPSKLSRLLRPCHLRRRMRQWTSSRPPTTSSSSSTASSTLSYPTAYSTPTSTYTTRRTSLKKISST